MVYFKSSFSVKASKTILLAIFLTCLHRNIPVQAEPLQWAFAGLEKRTINALIIDPLNPNTLYAGTASGGVFKRTDGEMSWNPMNTGLMNLLIRALAIHPWDPAILYTGTLGGGIFKIDQKAIKDKK